jgi:hypothetical protein
MNKWGRLVLALDEVFGFENKKESNVRKVSQAFDEKTNEHVFILEYRIRVGHGKVQKQRPVHKKPVHNKQTQNKPVHKAPVENEPVNQDDYSLLQDINDRVVLPELQ